MPKCKYVIRDTIDNKYCVGEHIVVWETSKHKFYMFEWGINKAITFTSLKKAEQYLKKVQNFNPNACVVETYER